jgi:hypothetical protein
MLDPTAQFAIPPSFLRFADYLLRPQYSSKMVLVSSPESVIQGVIVGPEHDGIYQGATKTRAAVR